MSDAQPEPGGERDVVERAWALDGSASPPESQEESINLWQLPPETTTYQLTAANLQLLGISFRPDGCILIAGYGSGHTRIWRLEQIDV